MRISAIGEILKEGTRYCNRIFENGIAPKAMPFLCDFVITRVRNKVYQKQNYIAYQWSKV